MSEIRSLCVFCGSMRGGDPAHAALAAEVGRACAERGIELVYGGGAIGLMGILADAALAAGGRVVGIIPHFLERPEIAHPGLSEIVVVDSMHARKQRFFARAEAFAVLPGGIGTLDETVEILTWRQLRLHDKPVLLVDRGGYWLPLRALLEHMVRGGFALPETLSLFEVVGSVEALFAALAASPPARLPGAEERL